MNIVTQLLEVTDHQINSYIFNAYNVVTRDLASTLTILLVLYFVGLGWLVLRGIASISPVAFTWQILKVSAIYIVVIHWGYWGQDIDNFLINWPNHLLASILNHLSTNGINNTSTMTESLANIWQQGCNLFFNLWQNSPPDFMLGTLLGFTGLATVVLLTGVPLFYLIMSKIALAILLILAPLILPLFLWESTQNILMGWFRLLLRWSLTPFFVYILLSLYSDLIEHQLNVMTAMVIPTSAAILTFILLTIIVVAIIFQGAKMADEISKKLSIHPYLFHGLKKDI